MENITEMSDRAEQYYISTNRWVSDLEFFQVEADFLRNLQQDYFISLSEPVDIEKLKDIGNKLLKLQLNMKDAHKECSLQLDRLTQIAENKATEDISYLSVKSNSLSDLISNLTQEYFDVKKELFQLAENIMREKKFLPAIEQTT